MNDEQMLPDMAIEHLKRRTSGAYGRVFRTLEEALPNVRFRDRAGRLHQPTVLAVMGRISEAEPGVAFRDEETGSEPLDFGNPSADWRTLHLQIDVEEVLGGAAPSPPVVVGLAVSGGEDPEALAESLESLGDVFLLLAEAGPVFNYDRSLYRILGDGALLATVSRDGRLHFPVLDPSDEAALVGELRTIGDVRREAAEPIKERPIPSEYPQGL